MTTITITPSAIQKLLEGEIIELTGGPTIKLRFGREKQEPTESPENPSTIDAPPRVEVFPTPAVEDLTCAKCGAKAETRRAAGQHSRWCGKKAVKPAEVGDLACPTCGKVFKYTASFTKHKESCASGAPRYRQPSQLPIGSVCHGAPVQIGERHPHGDRYCTECGEPCLWKRMQLPPAMPKPVKVLTQEERELLEAVRGDDDDAAF